MQELDVKLLVNLSGDDIQSAGLLKAMLHARGHSAASIHRSLSMEQLLAYAKQVKAEAILCSNPDTLNNIINIGSKSEEEGVSLWRGARINFSIPVLVIEPTYHITAVQHGQFLMENDLEKLKYIRLPTYKYRYTICVQRELFRKAVADCHRASVVVFDIETSRQNTITSVAFTCLGPRGEIGNTYCIPLVGWSKEEEVADAIRTIKAILEDEGPVKAAHNGAFDCFHLIRHGISVANYVWDTEYLWWCWNAELKKSLAFISSVLLPDYYYWKSESESDPLGYNCKDTINTARCLVSILGKMPAWAMRNYARTYPLVTPLISTAFEGFKVSESVLDRLRPEAKTIVERTAETLQIMTATPKFNPGSPKQLSILFYQVLGAVKPSRTKSATGTDAITLKKIALQHPLVSRFVAEVTEYRKHAKAYSTYFTAHMISTGADSLGGSRALYSLQPDGTKSSRLSSNKSSLYVAGSAENYGLQIQNIPPYMREAMIADDGYLIGEADKSQSEARCTAYLADDELLIEDLETPGRDFYCYMAYRFFGIRIDKSDPIRQLVKKIVHGTNYLMQEDTFIDNVGIKELYGFKQMLKHKGTLKEFAAYLLGLYHVTYPRVSAWWAESARQIKLTGSVATPDGWTRRVFGDPVKNAEVRRGIISHMPQHLSVSTLNKAIVRVYYDLQLPSAGAFRFKLQNHDSILFQAREEVFDHYMEAVIDIMDEPIKVASGKVMRIPVDAKFGKNWKEMTAWTAGRKDN
jgi:DNA polymerase I-like protein with 3'-5' exonuclease and polymerase domains